MRVVRTGLVCLVTLCVAASVSLAEKEGAKGKGPHGGDKGERGKAMFSKMDTDGNGTVSLGEFSAAHDKRVAMRKEQMGDKWDEAKAAKMPAAADIFKKMDGDGNGELTAEEMAAAHKKHMEAGAGERKHGEAKAKGGAVKECPKKKAVEEAVEEAAE